MLSRNEKTAMFWKLFEVPTKMGSYDKSIVPRQRKERALETIHLIGPQSSLRLISPDPNLCCTKDTTQCPLSLTCSYGSVQHHKNALKAGAKTVQEIIKSMYYPRFLGKTVQ